MFFSLLQPWPTDFAFEKWEEKPWTEVVLFSLLPFDSFSSLLLFFFPSRSLMWFSALSSDAKKLPFGPFPINWQANFSKFVFKNPAGNKLHYRRNTTGDPGSKCLLTAIKVHKEMHLCCFFIIVSFCPMNAILASFKVRTARTSKHAKRVFIESVFSNLYNLRFWPRPSKYQISCIPFILLDWA